MKKSILLLISILSVSLNCMAQYESENKDKSQIAEYGKITGNAFYSAYVSKTGDIIHEGDTLIIGKPNGEFGFTYIQQGGMRVANKLAGKQAVITQIKSYGTKKRGYTLFVQFKGWGLAPVFIDYDNALQTGEIMNPKGRMTREQAIAKLKESKELLDLQMITQAKYDSLKTKLAPIIQVN